MRIFKSTINKGDFNLQIDDIELDDNEINIVLGENGCGKSTFAKALYNKKIKCDEENVTMLKQKPYVYNQKVCDIIKSVIKWNNSDTNIDEFLKKYDLASKSDVSIKKLSGGEFRRLALGLILCTNSKLLILDEPFAGIDIKSQKNIINILEEEKARRTIILISHKMSICKKLGSKFIFMKDGKIVSVASKKDFFESENLYIKNFLEMEV